VRADEKARNDERLVSRARGNQFRHAQSWDMKEASAQVQLVDVLQFLVEQGEPPLPLRVAVLISAWDTVGGAGDIRPTEPQQFLERNGRSSRNTYKQSFLIHR